MIELREFALADSPFLVSWIDGPTQLLTWAGPTFTWPLDAQQLAAYATESARRTWMGVDSATGDPVGHASLRIDADTARLGRVLVAPEARGRGVGADLLTEVLMVAFGPLDLRRVTLGVFAHNTSALGLYERLGFRKDGVIEDVERVDGQAWSAVQMSQSRTNWAARA